MGFVNRDNAGRPGDETYTSIIDDIKEQGVCPFCPDHLHEFHKKPILEETEHWVATENMYPYEGAREHLLVIHKNHIETLGEMSVNAWQELQMVITGITRAREIDGATMVFRFGDTRFTGASVSHLHAQLVSGSGEPGAPPTLARVG